MKRPVDEEGGGGIGASLETLLVEVPILTAAHLDQLEAALMDAERAQRRAGREIKRIRQVIAEARRRFGGPTPAPTPAPPREPPALRIVDEKDGRKL